jgi:hypothetical protein
VERHKINSAAAGLQELIASNAGSENLRRAAIAIPGERRWIDAMSSGERRRLNSERARAWRNTMVAAINAGLAQKLFGLRPDDEDPKPHVFEFSVDGISGLGYVHPIGWGELSIHAALWPTAEARRWIVCGNITHHHCGKLVGGVVACGWLERLTDRYLMASPSLFYCRAARKPIVAAFAMTPEGYKDHGRFIF